MILVQFRIINRHHGKLFRFLDREAPGWKLSIRQENITYHTLCAQRNLDDRRHADRLVSMLRHHNWNTRGYAENTPEHHEYVTRPVIQMTAEQSVMCKMFWPDQIELFDEPVATNYNSLP